MRTPDEDLLAIVDHLDGRLDEDAMIAFELRLAAEPELATEYEEFERIDALQRAVLIEKRRATTLAPRPRRAPLVWGALAAALLALAGGLWWLQPRAPAIRATILASAATLQDHHAGLELPEAARGRLPAGFGPRGGEVETVSASEYLALTADAERGRIRAALATPDRGAAASYFQIPVQSAEDAYAVVLLVTFDERVIGARGEPGGIAFPTDSTWNRSVGSLPAGRDTVLPAPSLTLVPAAPDSTGPRVEYSPGFLVPRRSGGVQALLGVRRQPLDVELRSALVDTIAAGPTPATDVLSAWLERNGFEVHRLSVEEP